MGNDFTLLGFFIDNRLEKLRKNLDTINQKVTKLINKWKLYNLSVHGRITITKSMLISQYTYILTILDVAEESDIEQIQLHINNFIAYNTYEIKKNPGYLTQYYIATQMQGDST